jgi:hypothetical protein
MRWLRVWCHTEECRVSCKALRNTLGQRKVAVEPKQDLSAAGVSHCRCCLW